MSNKLSEPVLVLNRGYQAIHVIKARKAVSLLYQNVAEAIDDDFASYPYNLWCDLIIDSNKYNCLRSPSVTVRIPHVIRLTVYDKLPIKEVLFNRKNIYARDNNSCQYCGKTFRPENLTFDHIFPRSRGGGNGWQNIVTCCLKCNSLKGDKTPKEVGMTLIRKPVKPRWRSYIKIPFSRLKETKMKIWQEFLHKPYWEIGR